MKKFEIVKNKPKELLFIIDIDTKSLCSLFIGQFLKKGKKNIAYKSFLEVIKLLKKNVKDKKAIEVVLESLNNISPLVRLKSKKVGGMVYQIPVPLSRKKEYSMGIKWLLNNRNLQSLDIVNKLYKDILESYKKEGELIKRKDVDHKLAMDNRPFLKFLNR